MSRDLTLVHSLTSTSIAQESERASDLVSLIRSRSQSQRDDDDAETQQRHIVRKEHEFMDSVLLDVAIVMLRLRFVTLV